MNETLKIIKRRRSTRSFLDKEITTEDKKAILDACMMAPTAGNMQLYSIIDVTKQELKDKLSVLCDNQPFIKDGKMVLLFLTNALRWYEVYNEVNQTNLLPTISDYYLCMNDALISAQNAVIAAESLNIGSCYIGDIVENYEEIKDIFKLPKYVNPVCLLVFGYKKDNEEKAGPKRFNVNDVVTENEYKNNSFETFINKFDNYNDTNIKTEKATSIVNAVFKHKIFAPFFTEMNRSLTFMINEYLIDSNDSHKKPNK